MTAEEKVLTKTLEDGLADVLRADSVGLARVPRSEPTLPDQIAQLSRLNERFTDKVRREQLSLKNAYERQWVEINTTFTARISDEVYKLEKARDAELLALTETTSQKLHELEQLARRSG